MPHWPSVPFPLLYSPPGLGSHQPRLCPGELCLLPCSVEAHSQSSPGAGVVGPALSLPAGFSGLVVSSSGELVKVGSSQSVPWRREALWRDSCPPLGMGIYPGGPRAHVGCWMVLLFTHQDTSFRIDWQEKDSSMCSQRAPRFWVLNVNEQKWARGMNMIQILTIKCLWVPEASLKYFLQDLLAALCACINVTHLKYGAQYW